MNHNLLDLIFCTTKCCTTANIPRVDIMWIDTDNDLVSRHLMTLNALDTVALTKTIPTCHDLAILHIHTNTDTAFCWLDTIHATSTTDVGRQLQDLASSQSASH